jgi:hypothetical protein
VQSDWGGEYEKLNSFFTKVGITHLVSCPHTHQQNGAAERKHRHIVEVGLSLLAHAHMPLKFWDEAFLTATYLINRMPSKIINFDTPLERLFHTKPDYGSLRTFGCACWPNLRPYNDHKLSFRSKECTFLGYSNLHKGFKCLDISTGRIYISRDVVFDEDVFPFSKLHPNAGARLRSEILLLPSNLLNPSFGDDFVVDSMTNAANPEFFGARNNSSQGETEEIGPGTTHGVDPARLLRVPALESGPIIGAGTAAGGAQQDSAVQQQPGAATCPGHLPSAAPHQSPSATGCASAPGGDAARQQPPTATPVSEAASELESVPALSPGSSAPAQAGSFASGSSQPQPEEQTRPRTRLQAGIRQPKVYSDGTVRYGMLTSTGEPQTLEEALGNKNWKEAMDVEYNALIKNNTWHLVPPKKGSNIIDSKWVYRVKYNADGSLDKYKARLVAKGFKQRYGID